ncbi:MAG: hypothetical protein ABIH18_06160 [Candidatus Omnitrophota bacterium]
MDKDIILKIKAGLGVFIFVFCIFLSGCETIGGLGKGIACGAGSTAQGIGKDGHNFCEAIGKADQWIKDNLW